MYQNHKIILAKGINNAYNCNICGKSFAIPARLTRHYRTHTGEKPFQCDYCKKSFSVKENLIVHRRIHTNERPYKCEICEKAFEHSGKLHRHMRIHTGERPHKCLSCNKTFIQSGQLVIHMRTHTGEKPYICRLCGKGFTCSKQLKVHSRTHTGEKPYKCDICNKSFGYNHVLKLHQASHYGEKFYKCILCQDTFNSKKIMESHVKTHSKSTINYCSESASKNRNCFQNKIIDHHSQSLFLSNIEETALAKYDKCNVRKEKSIHEHTNSIHTNLYMRTYTKNNETVSTIIPHKICTHISSKNIFSNQFNLVNKKINCIDNDDTSNNLAYSNNLISNASCFFKIQNGGDASEELLSCYLNDNNVQHDDINDLKQIQIQQDICNPHIQLLKKTVIHNDETKSFYLNEIDFALTKKKEILSLPPRKRSQMILKSLEMEKPEIINDRYSSVIKFAKRDSSIQHI